MLATHGLVWPATAYTRLLDAARVPGLRGWLSEFVIFGVKQASACLFGGALLGLMIATHYWYPWTSIARYDLLFLAAMLIQTLLLATRLETWEEARIILLFHLVATAMELFKTSDAIGSWRYPDEAIFKIANFPLFAGFMYSAVGSYIARIWRIFRFEFRGYPSTWSTAVLALAIYANFFTHHFWYDLRPGLFALIALLFARTRIVFTVAHRPRSMPLLLGLGLVALFIWFAENLGTFTHVWLYPTQDDAWHPVPIQKLGAWFLLMFISFVMVSWLHFRPTVEETSAGYS
jgi:uncharacterized membrane protein YoaT (DUF817 family)